MVNRNEKQEGKRGMGKRNGKEEHRGRTEERNGNYEREKGPPQALNICLTKVKVRRRHPQTIEEHMASTGGKSQQDRGKEDRVKRRWGYFLSMC